MKTSKEQSGNSLRNRVRNMRQTYLNRADRTNDFKIHMKQVANNFAFKLLIGWLIGLLALPPMIRGLIEFLTENS